MKKTLITLAFGIIFFISNAQTKEDIQSKAEEFAEKSGTLIQKEYIDIGSLKKCTIQLVHFTDLNSNSHLSAIKFEYEISTGSITDSKPSYIDIDEIDNLMKSIKIMQEKVNSYKPKNYTELYFHCRSGFESGCITENDNWKIYLILKKLDGERYVWITIADLALLYTYLEQAKDKL
ncbi:MAG: hypothetical protein ACOYO1_09785 [Bacteroidales bacterium]